MIDPDLLDRLAAALSVLSRLQLVPADDATMAEVASLADQWPLTGLELGGSDAAEATRRGLAAIADSRRAGETAREVQRDQDRLYGITARATVPPFESVHRDEEGLVFDAQTLEVRAAYRRAGLRAPELNREPDDHLGLELDFLARCCTASLDALDRGEPGIAEQYLELAGGFTRDHVLTWIPAVLVRAREAASTTWVRGLEELTLGAVLAWSEAAAAGDPPRDAEGGYVVVRAVRAAETRA